MMPAAKWRPQAYISSVADLDWRRLYGQGYRLVLTDLDNCLQGHGRREASPGALAHLRAMREAGLDVAVVSNAKRGRAAALAQNLERQGLAIPVYGEAGKPGKRALRQAMQDFSRKPSETLMLGDQYFTDALAGLGLVSTVLVRPVDSHEPWYIRLKRLAERLWFFCLALPFPYNELY